MRRFGKAKLINAFASMLSFLALLLQQPSDDPRSGLPPVSGDPRALPGERPPVPEPPVPATPDPVTPEVTPAEPPRSDLPLVIERTPTPSPAPTTQAAAPQAATPSRLPVPSGDPLAIDRAADPILAMARASVAEAQFEALVQQAVARSPRVDEAEAGIAEARAAEGEAKAGRYPVIDFGLNAQRSIIRNFDEDDFDTIVERARGRSRVDATVNAEQTVFDFGETEGRITAAAARLSGAASQATAEADQAALRAIAAWYDVFAFRAMVGLGEAFSATQNDLRAAIGERIRLGVSAPGDLPRVESYIAQADTDLARYRRQLANAEARFAEAYGVPAPPDLGRAPVMALPPISRDGAVLLARATPLVEGSAAVARAAAAEARAEKAATRPRLSAGIDAGRYGVLEGDNYDVRGRLTLRQRLFGGVDSRAAQFQARAGAAQARADRVRSEAERDASIAWSDVQALEQQLAALENSYVASRQSRDVLAERFRVARGTLFDLLDSERSYFNVAATYIRAISERDAAHYVLLSRTGRLLPTLGIAPSGEDAR